MYALSVLIAISWIFILWCPSFRHWTGATSTTAAASGHSRPATASATRDGGRRRQYVLRTVTGDAVSGAPDTQQILEEEIFEEGIPPTRATTANIGARREQYSSAAAAVQQQPPPALNPTASSELVLSAVAVPAPAPTLQRQHQRTAMTSQSLHYHQPRSEYWYPISSVRVARVFVEGAGSMQLVKFVVKCSYVPNHK